MRQRKLVKGIEAQTHETLDNIEKVLKDAGGELSDIYEVRMILKKREHFPIVDAIFKERIPAKGFIAHGYKGEPAAPRDGARDRGLRLSRQDRDRPQALYPEEGCGRALGPGQAQGAGAVSGDARGTLTAPPLRA